MAVTPADIHAVGTFKGVDEFAGITDPEIQLLIDEVSVLYGSGRIAEHPLKDTAIALHVAHLLHLSITAAGEGGGQLGNLFPTTSRSLEGVGSRGKGGAFGQWGGDGTDPLKIPSRYLWRLKSVRRSMRPSVMTTGDSGLGLPGGPYLLGLGIWEY